jgi:hypothetical protein
VGEKILCHPERSELIRKANRFTESKDPLFDGASTGIAGTFDQ